MTREVAIQTEPHRSMKTYIVVEDEQDWPHETYGAEVVLANKFLTDPAFAREKTAKVFNLCRSYHYQSLGYYVSLLAAARGQKPLPSVSTLVDFTLVSLVRLASDEMQELIDKSLAPLHSDDFTLSIYFGRNVAKRYDRLSQQIFRLFPAPLVKCTFKKDEEGWHLRSIKPMAMSDVPDSHHDLLLEYAAEFFEKRSVPQASALSNSRFHLAILYDEQGLEGPSDNKAIARLCKIADKMDISTELITREDYGRLAEFDALFIRETTNVNHYTFRFARRAQAEGLIVIDDPDSILRCSNKVFLAELLIRGKVPIPKSVTLYKKNLAEVAETIEFPCVLKQPDSAFSKGVLKAETKEQFLSEGKRLLEKSGLIIAQEFLPTDYDWRVGIIDGEPLFVCRYHMAKKHWQIVKHDTTSGKSDWGRTETIPLWEAPRHVIQTALQAANLVGDGLYGVDLKEKDGKCYIMEVNDNPDIVAGYEDAVAKDELYQKILEVFLRRVEKRRERK